MVYQWKAEARVKLDPQTVGERLEELRISQGGQLTPSAIVEDARPEGSPLHDHFEWRDEEAAARWREEQARYLVRHIVVAMGDEGEDEPRTVRAFVSVVQEEHPSYTSIQVAMSDDDLREQVLTQAKRELAEWSKRYRDLKEMAGVFSAIEEVIRA